MSNDKNVFLFAWILIIANECYMINPRRTDSHKHLGNFSYLWEANPRNNQNRQYNLRMGKNKYIMTCNCSWGTLPTRFSVSYMRLKYKIVGGTAVDDRENYPMMAGLQMKRDNCIFCGASIITEFHALTAAHCLTENRVSETILAMGTHHRCKEPNGKGQYIPLLDYYIHEYYDEESNNQDIAIVVTQRRIIFSINVGPTCIYTKPVTSTNEPILVLGWGRIGEHEAESRELLKVFLNYLPIRECVRKMPAGFINKNLNLQICTYSLNKDACSGDSGGPLFILDRKLNRIAQIALVSMGVGCARVGEPGINTALYPYLGWMQWTIERSMRKHHPQDYRRCGQSFCYATAPLRKET